MKLVLLNDGPGQASAYVADALAGIAGFGTVPEFLEACAVQDDLLAETARQFGEPFDRELGEPAAAAKTLRARLDARGYDVLDDPAAQRRQAESDADFDALLRTGQGEVLAQAGALAKVRQAMTKSAVAMSVAVAVAIGAAAAPDVAHAQSNALERLAKDALGGAAGAGLMGQFGKGRGRDAMRVIGGIAGVAVAESMQRPQQPPPGYPGNSAYPYPNQAYANPQAAGYGQNAGGTTPLSYDKQEKMAVQQRNYMVSRDAYARALLAAQSAEENRVLEPRSEEAAKLAAAAGGAAQTAGQRYNQVRSEFTNAYEVLARNGYVMQDFAYTYSLAQRPVSARDLAPRDMAGVPITPMQQARPAQTSGYEL